MCFIFFFCSDNYVHPGEWNNFKSKDKRENVSAATCPVVILVDSAEERVYIPELSGPSSASFLPIQDRGVLSKMLLPRLPDDHPGIQALDDILLPAFKLVFNECIEHGPVMEVIKEGTQRRVRKYIFKNQFLK